MTTTAVAVVLAAVAVATTTATTVTRHGVIVADMIVMVRMSTMSVDAHGVSRPTRAEAGSARKTPARRSTRQSMGRS